MPETVTVYSDEELGLQEGWELNPEDGQPLSPAIRRELRAARVLRLERDSAVQKAEAAERKYALAASGIPQDERGRFFIEHYDGPSDPAAAKAQFDALFGTDGTADGDGSANTDGQQRIAEAGVGETGNAVSALEQFQSDLKAARGDKAKLRALLMNAPPEAGIRLKDSVQ